MNKSSFIAYTAIIVVISILFIACTKKQIADDPTGNYIMEQVLVNNVDKTEQVIDGYFFQLLYPVTTDSRNIIGCSFYSKDSLIEKFHGMISIAIENKAWCFSVFSVFPTRPNYVKWNPFYSEGINEWPVIKSTKNQVWFKATNGQNDVIEVHIRRVMPNY